MSNPPFSGLLMRLPRGAAADLGLGVAGLRADGVAFKLEPLFTVSDGGGLGVDGAEGWEWHLARATGAVDGAHAWELAHRALEAGGFGAEEGVYVEPDLIQEWPYLGPDEFEALAAGAACEFDDQRPELPRVPNRFAWHLGDDFSQLGAARRSVGTVPDSDRVRIVHLDTGYDPGHQTKPEHLNLALQENFVDGETGNDAHDPKKEGFLKQPGHGTGTLSILAGNRFAFHGAGYDFDDYLGGAPQADIVPVRVASSVVQIKTSGIAQGIAYAAKLGHDEATRMHVVSMSMGGVASKAWADAVNKAYEAGIVLVTAAGNNFSAKLFAFPTHLIVYPARFRRVIAACGVMASRKPYYDLPFKAMQGNWGPSSKMATALSACTPNVAWASMGCPGIVDMRGAGTSSATPQVAAAAALYVQRHRAELLGYPKPWMRVEAVRHALFTSADKSADGGSSERLGQGIVQAARALQVQPLSSDVLRETPKDSASFAFFRVLTGIGLASSPESEMLALEATQLAQRWNDFDRPNAFEEALPDPDLPSEEISPAQTRKSIEALLDHPDASPQLRAHLEGVRRSLFGRSVPRRPAERPGAAAAPAPPARRAPRPDRPFVPPAPPYRQVRAFAFDPSLATQLDTAKISEIEFKIPWEKLAPGPVGEYLEVVDVDPASDCFYEPVDLDDPSILAQDGLSPSEGSPQFHQQMVYAVASLTIRHFERALGRRVLWRPGKPPEGANPKDDSVYVQRLRIYPHALRQRNAFYSPSKIALLFGYFNAPADASEGRAGGMVFTCLSHDIVAHETTHALLDGMHRRFITASNPDVLAFHEAFADLVALFQHFTFPEIVKHQIFTTRGEIRTNQNYLGQLATQFGHATGRRQALRDAIGKWNDETKRWEPHEPNPSECETETEPHKRGGILVAAVFDAFLSIYERRTVDLLRLATGGSGVLQPGALHPDLVARLAAEASKAAQHVLTMCIRALDYAPPVDITFGEYLRGIITADADVVRDDDLNYRVAFIEAFRRRGIQPRDVRVLSVESLLWRRPESDEAQPSAKLEKGLEVLQAFAQRFLFAESLAGEGKSREEVFRMQREVRFELHQWLKDHLTKAPEGKDDAAFLGLIESKSFEVHSARFALRASPDGDVVPQVVVSLLQTVPAPLDPEDPKGATMPFEGGCTIVADLRRQKICYCIRKNVASAGRLQRQQAFAADALGSPRATYLGVRPLATSGEPFALLHSGSN